MELKELTLKICDIFGCSSITTLPDKVMFALFSQNPTLYFEKYKELCPDLTVDWMQRVYQFYHADRKEKKRNKIIHLYLFLSWLLFLAIHHARKLCTIVALVPVL